MAFFEQAITVLQTLVIALGAGLGTVSYTHLVELTPEELEEIRKREERKDRLHQNYLKRKGLQKTRL